MFPKRAVERQQRHRNDEHYDSAVGAVEVGDWLRLGGGDWFVYAQRARWTMVGEEWREDTNVIRRPRTGTSSCWTDKKSVAKLKRFYKCDGSFDPVA